MRLTRSTRPATGPESAPEQVLLPFRRQGDRPWQRDPWRRSRPDGAPAEQPIDLRGLSRAMRRSRSWDEAPERPEPWRGAVASASAAAIAAAQAIIDAPAVPARGKGGLPGPPGAPGPPAPGYYRQPQPPRETGGLPGPASAPPAVPPWRRPMTPDHRRPVPIHGPVKRSAVGIHPGVSKVLAGLALIVAYLAICLSPLAIASIGHQGPRRPFAVELSVGLGYVGLAMMVLQFTLVSRIGWLSSPFGIDILQRFHRQASYVALLFVLAHPLLLLAQSLPTYLPLFDLRTAPWRARFGVSSVVALLLVVLVSVWRRKLRVPYEIWKVTHGFLSTAVMYLALAHMVLVNKFTGELGGRLVVVLVGVGIAAILAYRGWIEPRRHKFKPWRVADVIRERGRAATLVLEPDGHPGWTFLPGQFGWVTVGASPFSVVQHPFSLSSPADADANGRVAMTIKELGDWTKDVAAIRRGTRVFLDGPHGSFSIDVHQAPGYVFIAGGVGITPMYSMISTMCLRDDSRPAILFYSNPDWESITFREQLEELSGYMPNLEVVHVLKKGPPGWQGETGRINADVFRRNLPRRYRSFEYFICAATQMMDAVEEALLELGVSDYRIHSERFGMV